MCCLASLFSYRTNCTRVSVYISVAVTLGFRAKFNIPPRYGVKLKVHLSSGDLIFSHVRLVAKKCVLGSSRLSACINVAPTGRFRWNLILENFMKICRQTANVVKVGQKIGQVKLIRKYALLLPATKFRPKQHFCVTPNIFILLTDM